MRVSTVAIVLPFLAPAIAVAACSLEGGSAYIPAAELDGSSSDASTSSAPATDGATTDPGGPTLLSVSTNVEKLSEKEFVRFVVIATHPDGLANLVGGKVSVPDHTAVYGALTADQQGTYSLDLPWDDINHVRPIAFPAGKTELRAFSIEIFDTSGRKAVQTVSVELYCGGGQGAVAGKCDPFSACRPRIPGESCDEVCAAQSLACASTCSFNGELVGRIYSAEPCDANPEFLPSPSACSVETTADAGSVRCCCK